MEFTKEQLKRFHGVSEPPGPADPKVLARRKYHEAGARWLSKLSPRLHVLFFFTGLALVLLPALSTTWRAAVEAIAVFEKIFTDYSTFQGVALGNINLLSAICILNLCQEKNLPWGCDADVTTKDILKLDLYPKSLKEESSFWTYFIFELTASSIWMFLPFGVISYFIRTGS